MTAEAFPRPVGPAAPATQALYNRVRERQTGLTTTALVLENAPIPMTLQLFKNGVLLDHDGGYTIDDRAVTLGGAAIAGDVFVAHYTFRSTRTG